MELKVEREDGIHFIIPDGEVVTGEPERQLKEELEELRRFGNTKVVVDFSNVPYIDSSVLGQLVHGHSMLKKEGGGLKLLNPPPRIRDLLSLTRLITIFEIFDSREAVLASWR